jgi:hypothetical protein
MKSPVTYQGGKGRLAEEIVSHMLVPIDAIFHDFCCGSGAVSIALCETGHTPNNIVMVDKGPWGVFWKMIGEGTFELDKFRCLCNSIPSDCSAIKLYIEKIFAEPVGDDRIYNFLLLQASAIGGAAIWWEGSQWKRGSGFRDHWQPTETSNRRSPVNPMMPMPSTIYSRTVEISQRMFGVRGFCTSIETVNIDNSSGAVVYIDPPYNGTTGYAKPSLMSIRDIVSKLNCPCWVSESKPLSNKAWILSKGRSKGGMTGKRGKQSNEEWLSYFPNHPVSEEAK